MYVKNAELKCHLHLHSIKFADLCCHARSRRLSSSQSPSLSRIPASHLTLLNLQMRPGPVLLQRHQLRRGCVNVILSILLNYTRSGDMYTLDQDLLVIWNLQSGFLDLRFLCAKGRVYMSPLAPCPRPAARRTRSRSAVSQLKNRSYRSGVKRSAAEGSVCG